MSSGPYSPRDWSPSLLSKYRNLLFDCDGVLWHESDVVAGAIDTLKALEAKVTQRRLRQHRPAAATRPSPARHALTHSLHTSGPLRSVTVRATACCL